MLLWVLFAIMTAGLLAAVLRPLLRDHEEPDESAAPALAQVYASQLTEIEADLDRGAVTADEAAELRAEVGRRLLAQSSSGSDDQRQDRPPQSSSNGVVRSRAGLAIAVIIAAPAVAIGSYLTLGAPLLPSQPHATRIHQDTNGVRIAELVRRVEARLVQHPEDGKGWDVIAPVYMRTGRYEDAAHAWRTAARLLGETPERVLGLGEAEVFAGNGIVSEKAREALTRGVALQPDYLPAQFWLAIAKQQDGNLAEARTQLTALLERAGATTPLGRTIADRLQDIDAQLRSGGTTSSISTSDAETQAMIEGMVSGLAERLETDQKDFEGWRRLIRSYVVLKRPDEAMDALAQARGVFKGEPLRIAELDTLARTLNLSVVNREAQEQ